MLQHINERASKTHRASKLEYTSKVLSMSKTFGPATRMGPNIWNALRMQSEFLECTLNIQEYTKIFHSDGTPAHSASSVTWV